MKIDDLEKEDLIIDDFSILQNETEKSETQPPEK